MYPTEIHCFVITLCLRLCLYICVSLCINHALRSFFERAESVNVASVISPDVTALLLHWGLLVRAARKTCRFRYFKMQLDAVGLVGIFSMMQLALCVSEHTFQLVKSMIWADTHDWTACGYLCLDTWLSSPLFPSMDTVCLSSRVFNSASVKQVTETTTTTSILSFFLMQCIEKCTPIPFTALKYPTITCDATDL